MKQVQMAKSGERPPFPTLKGRKRRNSSSAKRQLSRQSGCCLSPGRDAAFGTADAGIPQGISAGFSVSRSPARTAQGGDAGPGEQPPPDARACSQHFPRAPPGQETERDFVPFVRPWAGMLSSKQNLDRKIPCLPLTLSLPPSPPAELCGEMLIRSEKGRSGRSPPTCGPSCRDRGHKANSALRTAAQLSQQRADSAAPGAGGGQGRRGEAGPGRGGA